MPPYHSYACVVLGDGNEATNAARVQIEAHIRSNYPSLRRTNADAADLLLAFGGDGTTLAAARAAAGSARHILAFHTGTKGFLATVRDPSRFVETFDAAMRGWRLRETPIPVIRAVIDASIPHRRIDHYAINDVLIDCSMTWLSMRVEMLSGGDVTTVKEIRGSGLCVISSIGSTTPMAVHLQCPPIDPSIRAFYVKGVNDTKQPTCGMIVSGAEQRLRIRLDAIETNRGIPENLRRAPALYLDGILVAELAASDTIELDYSPEAAKLLRYPEETLWQRPAKNKEDT